MKKIPWCTYMHKAYSHSFSTLSDTKLYLVFPPRLKCVCVCLLCSIYEKQTNGVCKDYFVCFCAFAQKKKKVAQCEINIKIWNYPNT